MINVTPPVNFTSVPQALPPLPSDLPFDLLLGAVPTPGAPGVGAPATPQRAELPTTERPAGELVEAGATLLAFLGLNPAKAPQSGAAVATLPPVGTDDEDDINPTDTIAPAPTAMFAAPQPFALAVAANAPSALQFGFTPAAGAATRDDPSGTASGLPRTVGTLSGLDRSLGAPLSPSAHSAGVFDVSRALFADATGAGAPAVPNDAPLLPGSGLAPNTAPTPLAATRRDMPSTEAAQLAVAVAATTVAPAPARPAVASAASSDSPEERAADVELLSSSPTATISAPPPSPLANGPTAASAIAQTDPLQTIADRQLDLARDTRWIDELARDIVSTSGRSDRLSFSLIPPQLGQLHVELSHSDQGLSVHMRSESEATTQIVGAAQPRLVDELKGQGIRVASTEVSTGGGQSQGQGQGQQQRDDSQLFEFARQRFETSDDKESDRPGGRFA
jgi:flagellar hook-length control protein FliK